MALAVLVARATTSHYEIMERPSHVVYDALYDFSSYYSVKRSEGLVNIQSTSFPLVLVQSTEYPISC